MCVIGHLGKFIQGVLLIRDLLGTGFESKI
jgi:hypothetical protein